MQAKVSVIVPLFEREAYVEGLLAQLRDQTLRDVEFILVDDGSTDGTLPLLERAASEDPRIRVVSRDHGGAGAARNEGLRLAQGHYVMFLDADDSFETTLVEEMYEAADAHGVDIAVCRIGQEDHRSGIVLHGLGYDERRVRPGRVFDPSEMSDPFAVFTPHPYNKIWRREWVLEQGLRFSETQAFNDAFFSFTSIAKAERMVVIGRELYRYQVYREQDSISSRRMEHATDVLLVYRDMYDWLGRNGLVGRLRDSYLGLWRKVVRGATWFGRREEFATALADVLSEEEPWRSMGDRELQREAGLQTLTTSLKLWKMRRGREGRSAYDELMIGQLENEKAIFQEVIRQLNRRGRKLRMSVGPLRVALWRLSPRRP